MYKDEIILFYTSKGIYAKMEKFLPWRRKVIGGVKAFLQPYQPERFDQVLQLFQNSIQDSRGVGEGEFQTAKDLERYLAKSCAAFTYHDEDNMDQLMGFVMLFDTPLARSTNPLYGCGYGVLDKEYRGNKLYTGVWDVYVYALRKCGYPGSLSRNALTAITAITNLKSGATMSAVIPNSINIPKLGWLCELTPLSIFFTFDEEDKQKVGRFSYLLIYNK